VVAALDRIIAHPPSAAELASEVQNKQVEKHHGVVGEPLLNADYASSRLDIEAALQAAEGVRHATVADGSPQQQYHHP
jgi:hypothetical protein